MFLGKYLIWVMLLLGQICGSKSCIKKERNALFELKKYIISLSEEGKSNDHLTTWTNDTKSDCCMWKGLKCDPTSGRVIELSISLPYLKLKESALLNLSLLHPFEEVRSLDIDGSQFSGLFDDVEGYRSLRRLRNLETLRLSSNSFNNSIFPFLSAATSLTTLSLRYNDMDGSFPVKELRDLMNLEVLDLSGNGFNGSIPIQEFTYMRKLKALSLVGNEVFGSIELQGVCKLKHIEELDLRRNKLVGQFPLCITSLTGLRVLDLSSNNLIGNVPSALSSLKSLEYLSLFDNNFEGFFSLGSLTNLSKLKVLKLGSTFTSLELEESDSFWKPKFQLRAISLASCNLEKVPHFLEYQNDLRHVDLSNNKIAGKFPSWLLEKNTKLKVLILQNNSFRSFQLPQYDHNLIFLDVSLNEFDHLFPENIGWILPHLQYMNLAKNGFQGNLPSSLGNLKDIEFLDISHNNFQGVLPRSFLEGCYSLQILKMSHNKLTGEVFLESANFTGKIGKGWQSSKSLYMLDISNNNLSGVIPSWICELPSLYALLLSNNSLEGEIPLSLFNTTDLKLLDLSTNMLSGGIPSLVSSRYPKVLLLQVNNFSGAIPDTLLGNVNILDLRYNRFSGNIPEFINTQNINILLLRGNHLTGPIPHQLCGRSYIQLLDLANNRLNGSIPSCLGDTSFGFMKEIIFDINYGAGIFSLAGSDIYFKSLIGEEQFLKPYEVFNQIFNQLKVEFATKHRYDTYFGGNLKLFFGMDLSENEFSGEIPVEFGHLLKLKSLNLSNNKLSGVIPKSFSGLKNVESLDLSFNRLQGRIPPQLTDLSSLAVFNVSFNNLSGVIPEGRQFNTFDTESYLGNTFLCGQTNKISCNGDIFQEPDNGVEADESTTIDMESFYWILAAAYVTILLGLFVSLSFDSPWSRVWFYNVDVFVHKVRKLL